MLKFFIYIVSAGVAVTANAHPLKGAIESLSKAASDLRAIESESTEIGRESTRLKKQVEVVWADAITAPLRAGERQFKEQSESLAANAKRFNTEKIAELIRQIEEAKKTQIEVIQMMADPVIIGAMSPTATRNVRRTMDGQRLDLLQSLRDRAEESIACIQYFSQAFRETGLHPILNSRGEYAWNLDDLNREYGIMDLSFLPADRKSTVLARLKQLSVRAQEYQSLCVDQDAQSFMYEQRKMVESK